MKKETNTMTSKHSEQAKEEALNLRRAGSSTKEIATRTGIPQIFDLHSQPSHKSKK